MVPGAASRAAGAAESGNQFAHFSLVVFVLFVPGLARVRSVFSRAEPFHSDASGLQIDARLWSLRFDA